ncbi:hypothetical protein [Candidatus Methanodesulfokora washburnensis]|uniref:Uncharacterized protein n=1 Tax=Candidatus Methanodesulfokora washburnensis TaxID=2478471 RepID=A0A3R9RKH3_9CREN|nr:hypothetical protein [Candidatus Methanodesulfokores washburnensis]RSN72274.1 hypothetical protein D6D85_14475 [Candidatus Methanodesulfokores washburnensis]
MNEKEAREVFSRKCEELGGYLEGSSYERTFTCRLRSMESGRKMMEFIRDLDIPDDMDVGVRIDADKRVLVFKKENLKKSPYTEHTFRIWIEETPSPLDRATSTMIKKEALKLESEMKKKLPENTSIYVIPSNDIGFSIVKVSLLSPKGHDVAPIIEEMIDRIEKLWNKIERGEGMERVGERSFIEI